MSTPLRVLILEDQPDDAELMLEELRRAGFAPEWRRVETESDYMAQLDSSLDMVLADYVLPRFNARRALERLQECGLDVPFIVVSGAISEEVALDCLKRGAADYLLKDRLGRLGMAVMSVLEQRRLAGEKRRAEAALQESEACYRILVEGSIQGMYIHREGIIQFANRAMATIFGYDSPTHLIGLNYRRLVAPQERARLEGYRTSRLRGDWAPSRYEYQGMRKDGQLIWIECLASLVPSNGQPAIMATLIDINERKLAEEALREAKNVLERTVAGRTLELKELNVRLLADIARRQHAEEALWKSHNLLCAVIEGTTDAVFVKDLQGRYLMINSAGARLLGKSVEEVIGHDDTALFSSETARELMERDRRVLSAGETLTFEETGTAAGVTRTYLSIKGVYRDEVGNIIGLIGIARDISERKRAEEALRESNRRVVNILDSITDGFIALDQEWRFTYINRQAAEIFQRMNRTRDELLGKRIWEEFPQAIGSIFFEQYHKAVADQIAVQFEGFIPPLNTWFDVHAYPSQEGLSIYLSDITHRKRAEEQIKASLQEKELLLKEIHHRVKNNLQVISSLLSLQAGDIEDPHTRQLFSDSQHRVKSMALIHEKLYQSKNLAGIDLPEYIRCLADDLIRSYGVDGERITLEINAEEVFLKIDAAIPCGLILHELLSNCIKHAFPEGRPGEIRIDLWLDPQGHLCLLVRDNGIGLPVELDFLNTDSLGLQLVKMLTEQLDGTIELAQDKGTAFSITFAGLKYQTNGSKSDG